MIHYRRASKNDIDNIDKFLKKNGDYILQTFTKLWNERNYWKKHIPIIALDNNKIIGLLAYKDNYQYNNKNYIKIYYLIVDKNYRGKGIAYNMMNKIPKKDILYITEENSDGAMFCKRYNFQYIETKKNEFGTKDHYYIKKGGF